MAVSNAPNASRVRARVLDIAPADDGWGAWAELDVLEHEHLGGTAKPAQLVGQRIRAFVPPPLVGRIAKDGTYEGRVSWRGGPRDNFYVLEHD